MATMMDPEEQRECRPLSCYGRLECVFPKGEDGLRHDPEECSDCPDKVDCLRAALQSKDGISVREEKLDRAYASGHIGFFERWSRKKKYQQRKGRRGRFSNWLRRKKR
jgi:hypothetical protein